MRSISFISRKSRTVGYNNTTIYNNNPDTASKIVGSESLLMSRPVKIKMDDLTKYADLIIVGEVVTDAIEKASSLSFLFKKVSSELFSSRK